MSKIVFDDKKSIEELLKEPDNAKCSLTAFLKRQEAGVLLVSDEMRQAARDRKAIDGIRRKAAERRRRLFYDNLDLVLRHREEIAKTPRYANIDAGFALEGGGAYVGPLRTSMGFNVGGTAFDVGITLGTLLFDIWGNKAFQVACGCGAVAYVREFAGSPLSGDVWVEAICPRCGRTHHEGCGGFGSRYFHIGHMIQKELETAARRFVEKWNQAEAEFRNDKQKWSRPSPANYFDGEEEPCDLETLVNELRLKEIDAEANSELVERIRKIRREKDRGKGRRSPSGK